MQKELIGVVGIVLLVLVVVSVAQPSLFSFLNPIQSSPLPETTTVYAYGANGLVSKQKGDDVSYYHKDSLGSSSLVTDSSGDVVYSTDYYPFGSSLHEEGEEKYTYNSKELDSTGLYYYGARYYDSSIGRFISVDPVQGNLFNTQRLNKYSYVLNNPMKYVDPSGNEPRRAVIWVGNTKGFSEKWVEEHIAQTKKAHGERGFSNIDVRRVEDSIRIWDYKIMGPKYKKRGSLNVYLGHNNREGEAAIFEVETTLNKKYHTGISHVLYSIQLNDQNCEVLWCALAGSDGIVTMDYHQDWLDLLKENSYEDVLNMADNEFLRFPYQGDDMDSPGTLVVPYTSVDQLSGNQIENILGNIPDSPSMEFRDLGYADNTLEIPELE